MDSLLSLRRQASPSSARLSPALSRGVIAASPRRRPAARPASDHAADRGPALTLPSPPTRTALADPPQALAQPRGCRQHGAVLVLDGLSHSARPSPRPRMPRMSPATDPPFPVVLVGYQMGGSSLHFLHVATPARQAPTARGRARIGHTDGCRGVHRSSRHWRQSTIDGRLDARR